jgi:CheY-like chemotaxis protein
VRLGTVYAHHRDASLRIRELPTAFRHEVVYSAANGKELLQACAELVVDLVIVDLDMPVMDGLTAAEELAERGIPAVLVSGHPDIEEVVLEHEPVVTRVMKPATIDKLREAIRIALHR